MFDGEVDLSEVNWVPDSNLPIEVNHAEFRIMLGAARFRFIGTVSVKLSIYLVANRKVCVNLEIA